jgi:anaerobic magnesium-protoporphyrin IX monomethyl ester cyclase
MKIVLIYPRWSDAQDKHITVFSKKQGHYPPLGLAVLASIAEQQGHTVYIIDGEVEDFSTETTVRLTEKLKPDMIGITASTPFFHIAVNIAKKLKQKRSAPILIGGSHITLMREEAFEDCFDYGFIGESELSFAEFLQKYPHVSKVKGILRWRKIKGKCATCYRAVYNGDARAIQNLDWIPAPAYHLLPMGKYLMGTLEGTKPFFTVQTQRGCPFKCVFCNVELNTKQVRRFSPGYVVSQIQHIQRHYGISHFHLIDDTFTLNRKHATDICFEIVDQNIHITFEIGTRANLLDESIVNTLHMAGCIRIGFGLETVDENIRVVIKKEIPLQAYIDANRWCNKYNIETQNACMIGLPGETRDTIKKTMSFLRDTHEIRQANVAIAVPYPGTELYKMAIKEEHGLELLIDDFRKFQRYNNAVMKVGDLFPSDLIELQNDCFGSVYFPYWRWYSMLRKTGIRGFLLTWKRIIRSLLKRRTELLFVDPSYWRKT